MAKLTLKFETSITPQEFIDALTDFGPNRDLLWAHSKSEYLIVHAKDETSADVTEGSAAFGGAWERLRYDWSDPARVKLTTTDSNLWDNRSSWIYEITAASDDGPTRITFTVERFPRSNRGRLVLAFMSVFGKPILRSNFENTLQAIQIQEPHST